MSGFADPKAAEAIAEAARRRISVPHSFQSLAFLGLHGLPYLDVLVQALTDEDPAVSPSRRRYTCRG